MEGGFGLKGVIIGKKSFSFHLVLFLLSLAKGNVLFSCLLVEGSSAAMALGMGASLGCLEDLPLLLCGLVVISSCILDS
jgi:hypothetical protein